jgi:parallel beta-helix repeat protein
LLDGCRYDPNTNACATSVILSGLSLEVGSGLVINGASGVTIKGLTINSFPDDGILIQGGAQQVLIGDEQGRGRNIIIGNGRKPSATTGDDAYPAGIRIRGVNTAHNLVLGNWIGMGRDGQSIQGNKDGIRIINGASDNWIGGVTALQRNLISGNRDFGIYIERGSHKNSIRGNWIGVDAQGRQAAGNRYGIIISEGSHENQIGGTVTGAGNLISGNRTEHIRIETGSQRNRVRGNWIGVDVSGTYTVGVPVDGVTILQASDNQIGGVEAGARNLIAGCDVGIYIGNGQATDNTVQGNWIGVDSSGTKALGNEVGIVIIQGSANLIGGTVTGAGNLISSSNLSGIQILDNAKNNQVQGNWIGVDVTGMQALGNGSGILIDGASNNVIGGAVMAARNLISGNQQGVQLQGANTAQNRIMGNWIGVDSTGQGALGNLENGIGILNGPQYNIIGGATEGERNLISGNGWHGIQIQGVGASYNQIQGNFIGVDATGQSALGNVGQGVLLYSSASYNEIGGAMPGMGNVIGGNFSGVNISLGSNENSVQGNKIGVAVNGTGAIPNRTGVIIADSGQNLIGGAGAKEGNIISGNDDFGVLISGVTSSGNRIVGNFIGPDSTGEQRIGAQSLGVVIGSGANGNLVGGNNAGERNVISGNDSSGVSLFEPGTANNVVKGNYIGVDVTGNSVLSNTFGVLIFKAASKNWIGGDLPGEPNIISGNSDTGVVINGSGTTQNQIRGNLIGTDATGTNPLGNFWGMNVGNGANQNEIITNIISGNTQFGVSISGSGTIQNKLQSNLIGLDISGDIALGNRWGIFVNAGANGNLFTNNLISGNSELGFQLYGEGTTQNTLTGNYIGVNISATKAISNGIWGILINAGASGNVIGGHSEGAANVVSGNGAVGIHISDTTTINNRLIGNLVGVNATGKRSLGNGPINNLYKANGSGILLENTQQNEITNNLIAGNQKYGIYLLGKGTQANLVEKNRVGLSIDNQALPNQNSGLLIEEASTNQIGISNTIAFNLGSGIMISGTNAAGNTLTRNLIYGNRGVAIEWDTAPTATAPSIALYHADSRLVSGQACAGCTVELYAADRTQAEAQSYLGSTLADSNGAFTMTLSSPPTLPYITALATRPAPDGTTQPFAEPFKVAVSLPLYLPLVWR